MPSYPPALLASPERPPLPLTPACCGEQLFLVESGECFSAEINTSFRPGTIFGELALMYNSPRSCDIFCKRAARLWTLNRDDYRRIVAAGTKKQPTLRWEALQRAFYSHAGADGKLSVYELRSMLLEVFGIQLDHSDSTGTSLIEAMLDALDKDQSGDVDIDELHAAWRTWFGGPHTASNQPLAGVSANPILKSLTIES